MRIWRTGSSKAGSGRDGIGWSGRIVDQPASGVKRAAVSGAKSQDWSTQTAESACALERRLFFSLFGVRIEAPRGLAAKPAGSDVFLEERASAVLRVAKALVEDVQDVHADVQPDKIRQLERAHGMVHAEFHYGVHGFGRGDTFHDAVSGFVDERHEDAIGDEAGRVIDGDRSFAEALGKLDRRRESSVGGLQRADHLDERHDRDGIHEMHAHETPGAARERGESGQGDGRSVTGKDDVVAEEPVGFGEDSALQLELFRDGFHGEIRGGNSGYVGDRREAGEDGGLIGFRKLAFFHFAVEIFGDGIESAVEEALLDVAKDNFVTGARENMSDAVAHGAGAKHGHGLDGIGSGHGAILHDSLPYPCPRSGTVWSRASLLPERAMRLASLLPRNAGGKLRRRTATALTAPAKLRPVGAARPESGAADLRARLLAVFAARLGRALFRPLALSDLADDLAGAVLVLGACILRERFRGAARIRRPRYCFAFRRRKHGQQLVNGGRRIAEQLRRGQALDGVRLRRIEVEGFLDGEPGPFKKRKRHTELEGGEIAEMEEVVAPLHGFVGDAGLVEHVAKLEMQARIFAAPERAKRVLFRITGRDLRRRRGKRVRARRLAMDEWHAAVGANAEAIAVLSFAFRADHSNSIGPVQPGSGYPPRPPRAVSSARRPELRHCLRRGRVPRCRASDCGAEVRTAR